MKNHSLNHRLFLAMAGLILAGSAQMASAATVKGFVTSAANIVRKYIGIEYIANRLKKRDTKSDEKKLNNKSSGFDSKYEAAQKQRQNEGFKDAAVTTKSGDPIAPTVIDIKNNTLNKDKEEIIGIYRKEDIPYSHQSKGAKAAKMYGDGNRAFRENGHVEGEYEILDS